MDSFGDGFGDAHGDVSPFVFRLIFSHYSQNTRFVSEDRTNCLRTNSPQLSQFLGFVVSLFLYLAAKPFQAGLVQMPFPKLFRTAKGLDVVYGAYHRTLFKYSRSALRTISVGNAPVFLL